MLRGNMRLRLRCLWVFVGPVLGTLGQDEVDVGIEFDMVKVSVKG